MCICLFIYLLRKLRVTIFSQGIHVIEDLWWFLATSNRAIISIIKIVVLT